MNIPNLTIITLSKPAIKDFAAARNNALLHVQTDWVLFLDADETLSPALVKEIKATLARPGAFRAYRLKRQDTFLGRVLTHGENGTNRFVRLARRDWGQWQRPVHEVWLARRSPGEGGQGNSLVGELSSPLLHTLPDLTTFIARLNTYSTLEAEYRRSLGKHASLFHLVCYPVGKFIVNYFFRLGFLDGTPGLIMAVLMSFHSYLTWSKLYFALKR